MKDAAWKILSALLTAALIAVGAALMGYPTDKKVIFHRLHGHDIVITEIRKEQRTLALTVNAMAPQVEFIYNRMNTGSSRRRPRRGTHGQ